MHSAGGSAPQASAEGMPALAREPAAPSVGGGAAPPPQLAAPPPSKPGRLVFSHAGQKVYEWEQTLDDVLVYIFPPPGVKASQLLCTILPRHLTVGIKGLPPFLSESLASTCKAKESLWEFEAGEMTITLTKASKAETWPSVFVGHGALDPLAEAQAHKKMLLERFGQEHPGFDFSSAEVSGSVPDPKTFMGGF